MTSTAMSDVVLGLLIGAARAAARSTGSLGRGLDRRMSAVEVLPVIHVLDADQAMRYADVAAACGCRGVMLISMSGEDELLDPIAREIHAKHLFPLMGVNYLTMPSLPAALTRSVNVGYRITWTDQIVHSSGVSAPMRRASAIRLLAKYPHNVFVGVAFKGQRHDPDPPKAAAMARALGFVPTTSGDATGIAPVVDKIIKIRKGLGAFGPLAVASGVTPENVAEFKGVGVSHVLVSTGISKSFHEFDEEKLRRLMKASK